MSYPLRYLTDTIVDASRVTILVCDKADARGTIFIPPPLPETFSLVMEQVVKQIEQWSVNGMPLEEMPWQAAPTQIVEFKIPSDAFFPRGFLAEIEVSSQGQIRLYLSHRRLAEKSVEEWTRKCYRSILHYYRVLRPLQDCLASVRIVRVF